VLPLAPEFVVPQDGTKKQDCEINAAKRWLTANGQMLADYRVVFIADDLYSHEPFLQKVLSIPATTKTLFFHSQIRELSCRCYGTIGMFPSQVPH